jgi:integrase
MSTAPIQRRSQPIVREQKLTIQDLRQAIQTPFQILDGDLRIEKSQGGYTLRTPVNIPLDRALAVGEKGLVAYIIDSLATRRPLLIPFVFTNRSLVRMAARLLRRYSGSPGSLYTYTDNVQIYTRWMNHSPDAVIADCKPDGEIPDPIRVKNHLGFLEDYIATLQDDGLAPGTINNKIKEIRTFYRANNVKIELEEPLSRRVTYDDTAPTPDVVARMLEIADLRGRVIVSMLVLGGFRQETLANLKYRHVRAGLEKGETPILIHVGADIVKGHYASHRTCIREDAIEYLRLYIDERKRGSLDGRPGRRPPEQFADDTPILRDKTRNTPKGITTKQIRQEVHDLFVKTGQIKEKRGRMYNVRTHSLRKCFKTWLVQAGVPESHADYMMGHVEDTYNQVHSLSDEKLRQEYENSAISIRPRTKISQLDHVKELIRAYGRNPEKVLNEEAFNEGAETVLDEDENNHRLQTLRRLLRQYIREDINREGSMNSRVSG